MEIMTGLRKTLADDTAMGWCVVIARPMAEEVAEKAIVKAGYRAYLPRCRRILTGHRPGRGEPVLRPLFPRYLFAELHPEQGWYGIKRATGVSGLILDSDMRPALIADRIVVSIREREMAQEFDQQRDGKYAPLEIGQPVQLIAGPFAAMLGTVARLSGRHRAEVFLHALGRLVKIDRSNLGKVA